jgi:hypothetical protein
MVRLGCIVAAGFPHRVIRRGNAAIVVRRFYLNLPTTRFDAGCSPSIAARQGVRNGNG